jgi:aromatic ring-cleaving dioxygenase
MNEHLPFTTQYTHCHIYYTAQTRNIAVDLQQKILQGFSNKVQVGRLIDRPIGPHPTPMFEVDFHSEVARELVPFLETDRAGLSVLLHPVSEDEVGDHTQRAVWLGSKLDLDIQFLEDFMAGRVAGVSHEIKGNN